MYIYLLNIRLLSGTRTEPDVFALSGSEISFFHYPESGIGPEFFIFPRPGPEKNDSFLIRVRVQKMQSTSRQTLEDSKKSGAY